MVTSYVLFSTVIKMGCLSEVILDEYNFVKFYQSKLGMNVPCKVI